MALLYLPNGCHITFPIVHPKSWRAKNAPIKTDWYIKYRFYDPRFPKPKQVQLMGMNKYGTREARREITQYILDYELKQLMSGFNPYTDKRERNAWWRDKWKF